MDQQAAAHAVRQRQEVVGALILGFAVTAMHYTAMASTYCFATPGQGRSAPRSISRSSRPSPP